MARQKYSPLPLLTPEEIVKFWSHVNRGMPDECWPWTAAHSGGYGSFAIKRNGQWKTYRATRICWLLSKGYDPGSRGIAHRCDNPPCINPSHHFRATQKENIADCIEKGRSRKADFETLSSVRKKSWADHPEVYATGERCWKARLSAADIPTIRRMISDGMSNREIGDFFCVDRYAIYRIRIGIGWKHVS